MTSYLQRARVLISALLFACFLASVSTSTALALDVPPRVPNGWAYDLIRADEAHALGATGLGVRVAILDEGVSTLAPGIASKVVASYDATNEYSSRRYHGTASAGIVAAVTQIQAGVGGVAPDAEILSAKVCSDGSCRIEDIQQGLKWAIENQADVISMSNAGQGAIDGAVASLIKDATDDGIVVVAAAGNTACKAGHTNANGEFVSEWCTQSSLSVSFPSSYPIDGLISVAAVDKEKKRASFSSYNAQVDVAAPGVQVATTFPEGPFSDYGGTSAATPMVAGVVALVKQVAPSLTASEIQSVIQSSASEATTFSHNVWESCSYLLAGANPTCVGLSPARWPQRYYTGAGIVDAVAAIELAALMEQAKVTNLFTAPILSESSNTLGVDWANSGLSDGPYKVYLDGKFTAETNDTNLTIGSLIDEATYAVTVSDVMDNFTLPSLGRPTAYVSPAARVLARAFAGSFNLDINLSGAQTWRIGAILFSDGRRVSCNSGCPYEMPNGSAMVRFVEVDDSLGYIGVPTNAIAITARDKIPAPTNIGFSNVTESSATLTWDPVPSATGYVISIPGRGNQWSESNSIDIDNHMQGISLSAQVAVGSEPGNRTGIWSERYSYRAVPPPLDAPQGLNVVKLNSKALEVSFNPNSGADIVYTIRSDGRVSQWSSTGATIFDFYIDSDVGKTFTYQVLFLDNLDWGNPQYGNISEPFTVTVPDPKKTESIQVSITEQQLTYGQPQDFAASSMSGRPIAWSTEGPCSVDPVMPSGYRVTASSGVGSCLIFGDLQENDQWTSAHFEVEFSLARAEDAIFLSPYVSSIENGSEATYRLSSLSHRSVNWTVEGECSISFQSGDEIRVRANADSGDCHIQADVPGDDRYHAYSSDRFQNMSRPRDNVLMTSYAHIKFGKPIYVDYTTRSGKRPVFKTSSMCTISYIGATRIQIKSKQNVSGFCVLSAALADAPGQIVATTEIWNSLIAKRSSYKKAMVLE